MTATERLRELLDERGAEWSAVDDIDRHVTLWGVGEDGIAVFRGWSTGLTRFECTGLSPEQAVAATLGDTDATTTRQGDVDLKAENAKLRELVLALADCRNTTCDDCVRWDYPEGGCSLDGVMRELGVDG